MSSGEGKQLVDRRRWELSEISKKLNIQGLAAKDREYDSEVVNSIGEPAITVLLGDLNYRVTMNKEVILDFIDKRDYETILCHDQLLNDIQDNTIFSGFQEGQIEFPPTFKLLVHNDKKPGYQTERTPSYTDRIFFSKDTRINQLEYTSIDDENTTISDHRPVVSKMELTIPMINFEKRRVIVDSILKDLDKAENSHRPNLKVSDQDVRAQDCRVLKEREEWITLTHENEVKENLPTKGTSQVIEWEVIAQEQSLIKIEPTRGVLPFGAQQQLRLSCTLSVNSSRATRIFIIKVRDGADVFVSSEFEALPSCLGASLDLLSRMPEGVRCGKIMDTSSTNMPQEIWNCVDYLWTRELIPEDLFSNDKRDEHLQWQIQEWMDCGKSFDVEVLNSANRDHPHVATYSVANELVTLLYYLKGGIIPVESYFMVD